MRIEPGRKKARLVTQASAQQPDAKEVQPSAQGVWSEVQRQLGNSAMTGLVVDGARTPRDLYLTLLLDLGREQQLDTTPFLPWHADISWTTALMPFMRVLYETEVAVTGQEAGEATLESTAAQLPVAALSSMPGGAAETGDELDAYLASAGAGRDLTLEERALMERVHDRAPRHARIHEGPAARRMAASIDARAFAVGSDIYLGKPADVGTSRGAELIAHEAAHVLQHEAHRLPAADGEGRVSSPSDPHEREAAALGRRGARLGAEVASDPWGLDHLPTIGPVARAIVEVLRARLPPAGTPPPAAVVREALVEVVRAKAGRGHPPTPWTSPPSLRSPPPRSSPAKRPYAPGSSVWGR